ncbi:MAG: phosphoglycerate dehydrogenase [Nostocoides sp.]
MVLVTWPDYPDESSTSVAALTSVGLTVRRAPRLRDRSEDEVIELLRDCVAGIVSTDSITRRVIESSPALRILARVGVGTDSIDLEAATERQVAVTVARGSNEPAVADHTVGLMLALLRRIPQLDTMVRDERWLRTGPWAGHDLTGKTVGLLGMGTIAGLVARRLSGFDSRVIGYDPVAPPPPGVAPASFEEVVADSDVLSLHLPLTTHTRGMVDDRFLAAMKPGAVLINTSRGAIVDEVAVARALDEGRLAGAALDVFVREPPLGSPVLPRRENTVLTPHIAGLSHEAIDDMVGQATDAVVAAFSGRAPRGLVNDPRCPIWDGHIPSRVAGVNQPERKHNER